MFEQVASPAPDPILQIIADFAADQRPRKIDLGVGVFKDESGNTPVLDCVKQAERLLLERQVSKAYVGMLGDTGFNRRVTELVFGGQLDESRVASLQSPGGCGGLRLLFDAIHLARPDATVWLPDPGWPNHAAIVEGVGLEYRTYPYYDPSTSRLDVDGMMSTLAGLSPADVVVIHGCCHNPTGANLELSHWQTVAGLAVERGFLPFVDFAYHGFGVGLDGDAAGLREIAARVPEMLVAYSCSKNFGIYRDRTGAALVLARDGGQARRMLGQMTRIARAGYSMPPDHGAAVVGLILDDADLKRQWVDELSVMQTRLAGVREAVSTTLRERLGDGRFDFIGGQQGMFSLLGVSPEQVARLRAGHGVYMTTDSRMNIAGLRKADIPAFAEAVASVI